MAIYGTVTFYPRADEQLFTTQAHDGLDDLEGGFYYEFNDENGWKQPIYTRKDLEFFQARPERYAVEMANSRPQRPRPAAPEPVKPKPEPVVVSEVKEKVFVPPVEPARRAGRTRAPREDFQSKLEANMNK